MLVNSFSPQAHRLQACDRDSKGKSESKKETKREFEGKAFVWQHTVGVLAIIKRGQCFAWIFLQTFLTWIFPWFHLQFLFCFSFIRFVFHIFGYLLSRFLTAIDFRLRNMSWVVICVYLCLFVFARFLFRMTWIFCASICANKIMCTTLSELNGCACIFHCLFAAACCYCYYYYYLT